MLDDTHTRIEGTAAERYGAVERALRENFATRHDVGAAVAVYVGGELVVDLWGGLADPAAGRPWERDTLQVVHSTTKGLVALCLAMLVDRAALAYEAPVGAYWPEFAANGKEHITVAQLLSHQGGLSALDEPPSIETVADHDALAALLARQRPQWAPGTAHGYHPWTWGFYAAELVRRTDGRTVGGFLREEVSDLLGVDAYIGLPPELEPRVGKLVQARGPRAERDPTRPVVQAMMDPTSLTSRSLASFPAAEGNAMNRPDVHQLEIPSGNAITDARSLARIYAVLAAGGTLDGQRLCAPETLARATATQVDGDDLVLFQRTEFAMGFTKPGTAFFHVSPHPETFGHPGSGGSVAFADPVANVGFAYVMNAQKPGQSDARSQALIHALSECV